MLWSLVLLTALGTGLTGSGRSDLQLAANLRAAADAEMAADGAIYRAAYHLLERAAPWPVDGSRIPADWRDARVTICIMNEAGKINPNSASPGLLEALLRAVGSDTTEAQRIAASIYEWRTGNGLAGKVERYRQAGLRFGPTGTPFTSVAELASVMGMSSALLARISPFLTVLTTEDLDPLAASPVVLAALQGLVGANLDLEGEPNLPHVVTVAALAETRSGGRFVRRAALRLDASAGLQVLTWEEGEVASDCR